MANMKFTENEKLTAFDRMAEMFYSANFSRATKAEIELLMFDIYLEKLISQAKNDDGSVDYSKCSDYKISKELGITQDRVRNLKVKKQLVYPIEYDWQQSLAKLTKNARYDQISHKITIGIPDPNVHLEIQNFIEENGGYIEKQLNGKLLQIRAEYYIDLVASLEDETSRKKIVKCIKKQIKESGKDDTTFDEVNIGKSLLDAGVNVTTLMANISSLISPGNQIGSALINLLTSTI